MPKCTRHEIEAPHYCGKCAAYYCNDCEQTHRSFFVTPDHARVSAAIYENLQRIINLRPTKLEIESDKSNVFVAFTEEGKLSTQFKFHTIPVQDDARLPIVSFVGKSGNGKSLLLRLMISSDNLPKPLPGASTDSTSADIFAYICDFPNRAPTLLLDSEGFGGTKQPPLGASTHDWLPDTLIKRRNYVKFAYPRLLYSFSNVVCYVHYGSKKGLQSIVKKLVSYASDSSAGSVNQELPFLIVVLNQFNDIWNEEISNVFTTNELCEYYQHIRVFLYIPSSTNIQGFLAQVNELQTMIMDAIDKSNKIIMKGLVFEHITYAVNQLNYDPLIRLDFVDSILRNLPPPQKLSEYLVAFFKYIYEGFKKTLGAHQSFTKAFNALNSRLQTIFQHRFIRTQKVTAIRVEHQDGFNAMMNQITPHLEEATAKILEFKPCSAVSPSGNYCEQVKTSHPEHKSSALITKPSVGIWRFISGSHRIPDIWLGRYEGGEEEPTLRVNSPFNCQTIGTIWQQHRTVLSGLQEPCFEVCLGCVAQQSTERLKCRHMLCASCCSENKSTTHVTCPFCDKKCQWNFSEVPAGAGYRVLSLDGGGIRGYITALMLVEVEKRLGVRIPDLFDLIVGSGSGGLLALAYGESKRLEQIQSLFGDMTEKVFIRATFLRIPISPVLLWYKYKRTPIRKLISEYFSNEPLLGISTRVAVVAGIGPNSTCLLSSYNPAKVNKNYKRIRSTSRTVREVAEIFGAGFLFDVLNTPEMYGIDGSIVCNNPCKIAHEEAQLIWPEKELDILVSLGVGNWSIRDKELKNNIVTFFGEDVSLSEASTKAIASLSSNAKFFRLDPDLVIPFSVDDYRELNSMETSLYSFMKSNKIDDICCRLLAKLFYIDTTNTLSKKGSASIIVNTRISSIRQLTNETATYFSCKILTDYSDPTEAQFCFSSKYRNTFVRIDVRDDRLTVASIHVYCHIGYDGSKLENGFEISEPGSPFMCTNIEEGNPSGSVIYTMQNELLNI